MEVHIISIAKRNIHCVLSDAAEGMITGFEMHSYVLGLGAMLEILRKRSKTRRKSVSAPTQNSGNSSRAVTVLFCQQ